jgi:hypothetical protein
MTTPGSTPEDGERVYVEHRRHKHTTAESGKAPLDQREKYVSGFQ